MKRLLIVVLIFLSLFVPLSGNLLLAAEKNSLTEDLSRYLEFEVGIPFLFAPTNSFRNAYHDADLSLGTRLAVSYTRQRFRCELALLYQQFSDGEPDIYHHHERNIRSSESEMEVWQKELLFFWLKNEPNRVAFIGGGPTIVQTDEKFKLVFQDTGQSYHFKDTTVTNGYKLVVGGKDKNSRLKTIFSYTHAPVESKYGKKFNYGGYALTFQLSFGGPS